MLYWRLAQKKNIFESIDESKCKVISGQPNFKPHSALSNAFCFLREGNVTGYKDLRPPDNVKARAQTNKPKNLYRSAEMESLYLILGMIQTE